MKKQVSQRFACVSLTALTILLQSISPATSAPAARNKREYHGVVADEYLQYNAISAPSKISQHAMAKAETRNEHGHYSAANGKENGLNIGKNKSKLMAARAEIERQRVGANLMAERQQKMMARGENVDDNDESCNKLAGHDHNERLSPIPSTPPPELGLEPTLAKQIQLLRAGFVEQVIRQRVADKDHLLMEKWLVDNINDLHRELKQTELDFEHYVQVTKNILAKNELQLKRELTRQTSLPLWSAVPISGAGLTDYDTANTGRH